MKINIENVAAATFVVFCEHAKVDQMIKRLTWLEDFHDYIELRHEIFKAIENSDRMIDKLEDNYILRKEGSIEDVKRLRNQNDELFNKLERIHYQPA